MHVVVLLLDGGGLSLANLRASISFFMVLETELQTQTCLSETCFAVGVGDSSAVQPGEAEMTAKTCHTNPQMGDRQTETDLERVRVREREEE